MSAPAYQIEDLDFRLNLSCLVGGDKQDATLMQAISSVDILGGQRPDEALRQLTTLDQSQLMALQVILSTKPNSDMPVRTSCCQSWSTASMPVLCQAMTCPELPLDKTAMAININDVYVMLHCHQQPALLSAY